MYVHIYTHTYIHMYTSPIYIYIKGDVCLSVCPSVCLYHHSCQICGWISLKLGMMIGFDPTKHGQKISENSYHCNKKRIKNGNFVRKTLGATDLKLGMHIRRHSWVTKNMSWVPPGHTFIFSCVMLKMPKMVYQQKHLNLRSLTMNLYIYF